MSNAPQRERASTLLDHGVSATRLGQRAEGEGAKTRVVVRHIKDSIPGKGRGTQGEAVGGPSVDVPAGHHGQGVPISNGQHTHGVRGDRAGRVRTIHRDDGTARSHVEPRGERGVRVVAQFQTAPAKGHGARACPQSPGHRGDRRTFVEGKPSRVSRARPR